MEVVEECVKNCEVKNDLKDNKEEPKSNNSTIPIIQPIKSD